MQKKSHAKQSRCQPTIDGRRSTTRKIHSLSLRSFTPILDEQVLLPPSLHLSPPSHCKWLEVKISELNGVNLYLCFPPQAKFLALPHSCVLDLLTCFLRNSHGKFLTAKMKNADATYLVPCCLETLLRKHQLLSDSLAPERSVAHNGAGYSKQESEKVTDAVKPTVEIESCVLGHSVWWETNKSSLRGDM